MKVSDAGRALIESFEGLSLKAYPDPKLPKTSDGSWHPEQLWSIGYGHQLGRGAFEGKTITREEADRAFESDLAKFEAAVSLSAPNALQHQFDAMTSLAYNIGTAGFAGSSVARYHNMGDTASAADAFRLWNKSAGAVNPVLVARREKERGVYLHGYTPGGSYPVPAPSQSSPGWPETVSVASSTLGTAVMTSAAALGLGWLLYRLLQR